jgi:hypothetical protein
LRCHPTAAPGRAVAKRQEIAARARAGYGSAQLPPAGQAGRIIGAAAMLHLYVLYACVHINAAKHASGRGTTRCVEGQVFFHADECKKALPKPGALTEKSKQSRSWLECKQTAAESWIPVDATDRGTESCKAQADVADANALTALLAPLAPQARATLAPADLKLAFARAFQGPDRLSFFVVGTGSRVTVFAVANLDDFQFAGMAADFSSASESPTDLDFETIAEDAGVKLSYHTETSQRAMPPPGGME